MKIGIMAGTGPAGIGLGLRLSKSGHQVMIGSRDYDKAQAIVANLKKEPQYNELPLQGQQNQLVARDSEVIIVAAPWDACISMLQPLSEELKDKIVVSMANPLIRMASHFQAISLPRGSIASEIQIALPNSTVVGAFHHLPAKPLKNLSVVLDYDVLICSDSLDASATVASLVRSIKYLRPIEVGSLSLAGNLESMTATLLEINKKYKTTSTIRILGI